MITAENLNCKSAKLKSA